MRSPGMTPVLRAGKRRGIIALKYLLLSAQSWVRWTWSKRIIGWNHQEWEKSVLTDNRKETQLLICPEPFCLKYSEQKGSSRHHCKIPMQFRHCKDSYYWIVMEGVGNKCWFSVVLYSSHQNIQMAESAILYIVPFFGCF